MKHRIGLKDFWHTFEQILIENGEPFKIIHENSSKGIQTHYANVNKLKIRNNNCVDISLVRRSNFLRVGLYIYDKNSPVGKSILTYRQTINAKLSFTPDWEWGVRNVNTLWVVKKFPIDDKSCRELIEEALPIIMEFIGIAKEYGQNYFFDF